MNTRSKNGKAPDQSLDGTTHLDESTDNEATDASMSFSSPRSRKRKIDGAYNPQTSASYEKRRKLDDQGGTAQMRADNSKTVIDENGNEVLLKTAVIFNENSVGDISPVRVKNKLAEVQHRITPDRPVASIERREVASPGGTLRKTGSVIKVTTPEGTELHRRSRLGMVDVFSNHRSVLANSSIRRQLDFSADQSNAQINQLKDDFFKSDIYKNIKKIMSGKNTKERKIKLTREQLQKTKKEHAANNYRRPISQNDVMAVNKKRAKKSKKSAPSASAEKYIVESGVYGILQEHNVRCEWLHLIAYSFLGLSAQDDNNLVGGSEYANTEMMFVEDLAKRLALKYPQGVDVIVKADLMPGTHIAKKINYSITTPDYSLAFEFMPDAVTKPHMVIEKYLSKIVEAAEQAAAEKKQESQSSMSLLSSYSLFNSMSGETTAKKRESPNKKRPLSRRPSIIK